MILYQINSILYILTFPSQCRYLVQYWKGLVMIRFVASITLEVVVAIAVAVKLVEQDELLNIYTSIE